MAQCIPSLLYYLEVHLQNPIHAQRMQSIIFHLCAHHFSCTLCCTHVWRLFSARTKQQLTTQGLCVGNSDHIRKPVLNGLSTWPHTTVSSVLPEPHLNWSLWDLWQQGRWAIDQHVGFHWCIYPLFCPFHF